MGMCLSKAGGVLGFILGTQSREVRTMISGITSELVTTGPVTLKDPGLWLRVAAVVRKTLAQRN